MDGISSYNKFIAVHKPQLVLSAVPEHFWATLCKKLQDQIFDSGASFSLVRIDYEEEEVMPYDPIWSVIAIQDIQRADPNHIYLIDHAWTFKPNTVRHNLRNVPGLLERMCNLMQISDYDTEEKIEKVFKNIWKFANTYAISGNFSVEDRVPVWYILDELGSCISHSESPNFHAVPFIHVPEQITYTLLFPIEDLEEGENVTRNYVEGDYNDPIQRDAMLIPWRHYEHFNEPFTQVEPSKNYFFEGHIAETLPNLELLRIERNVTGKLKVYSEYTYINEYLTSEDFQIVHNENEADVLWYLNHFKSYKELSESTPNKFVNQFPFEYVITVKDLLAIVSRRCIEKSKTNGTDNLETYPLWLPTTFNLKTELSKFVSYYMQRKKTALDNHWICKPYNLARGLDTYITDNLHFLCRLPLTGPKIAQKYIENPVLFERPDVGSVKFDIRYVLLLTSVNPTKLYIYKNFFLRFSNKAFAMNNFDDYEQHFTVMNYNDSAPLYRIMCHEFKDAWAKQYKNFEWSDVEKKILNMFSDLFTAATMKESPCSIAKSPQSRALYAADIMLSWHEKNGEKIIEPKLLEINWMPDCQRACVYYPEFYNDIFSVMFLNKDVESCLKIL